MKDRGKKKTKQLKTPTGAVTVKEPPTAPVSLYKKGRKSHIFMIYPEFATCEAKTEPFRTPFYTVNMRFFPYLPGLKFFENMYLHYAPI